MWLLHEVSLLSILSVSLSQSPLTLGQVLDKMRKSLNGFRKMQ